MGENSVSWPPGGLWSYFGGNFLGRRQTWGGWDGWWRRCREGKGWREWRFGARFFCLLKIGKVSQLFQELATFLDGRRIGIRQHVMQSLTRGHGVVMTLVGGLIHFVDPRGRYESGWHGVHDRYFAHDGVKNVSRCEVKRLVWWLTKERNFWPCFRATECGVVWDVS